MSAMSFRSAAVAAVVFAAGAAAAPAARAVEFQEFDVGGAPAGIARGSDGHVWVADSADPGRILRVSTKGVPTAFSAGLTPGARPTQITQGPDGNVWFT